MGGLLKDCRIEDEFLDNVTGGTEITLSYGMDKDPLYRKFSDFWNGKKTDGVTGESSRKEFIDSFRRWVRDGMPENISSWYDANKA